MRETWSTQSVPDQTGLHGEIMSQKDKIKYEKQIFWDKDVFIAIDFPYLKKKTLKEIL